MKQHRLTIVAVACGLMCAVFVALFMASVQGEANAARAEALARYGGEQVEVCVATRDIAAGERLEASAVEMRNWIADLLPEGAVRESGAVVGKTAASSILKGEVVTEKRFESAYNALDIPAGKEAVSVPAKAVQAVGGAVRPGMSVDVYSAGDTTTAVLARDVIVLDTSVGESGSLISSESGWITLAVDAERVQEIIAASTATSLYFVIPGDADGATDGLPEAAKSADSADASVGKSAKGASQQSGKPENEGSESADEASSGIEPGTAEGASHEVPSGAGDDLPTGNQEEAAQELPDDGQVEGDGEGE